MITIKVCDSCIRTYKVICSWWHVAARGEGGHRNYRLGFGSHDGAFPGMFCVSYVFQICWEKKMKDTKDTASFSDDEISLKLQFHLSHQPDDITANIFIW